MQTSRTRFVLLFLVAAFAFQFLSNSILGSEVRLFPARDESFLRPESPIAWKRAVSTLLLPVKAVMFGPVLPLTRSQELPPPFLAIACALYWTILALSIRYLLGRFKRP